MRMMNSARGASGVVVRGVKNRRLVVSVPKSLEPIAVNISVSQIMQVAVLPVDKTEEGKERWTVAAQIGHEQWVRLAVFETATDAELLIEAVASVISGSRWPDILMMTGLSLVAGFIFVTLGAYYVTSNQPAAQQAATQAGYSGNPAMQLPQDTVSMSAPTMSAAPQEYTQQVAPMPAPAPAGPALRMSPENEAAMQAYFGQKK